MKTKYCKDCIHYIKKNQMCGRTTSTRTSPVDGKRYSFGGLECWDERHSSFEMDCGIIGRFFKQK